MSTLHQLREGLNEAWDTLVDGWQRLYRRASGAITRFTPGKKAREDNQGTGQEIAVRSAGWGVLAAEVFDVPAVLERIGRDRVSPTPTHQKRVVVAVVRHGDVGRAERARERRSRGVVLVGELGPQDHAERVAAIAWST